MTRALFALSLVAAACGTSSGDPPDARADAASSDAGQGEDVGQREDAGQAGPDAGMEPACSVLGQTILVPVGAARTATLSGEGFSEATIVSGPTGWQLNATGRRLEVQAPYVVGAADQPALVRVRCGAVEAQAELRLEATPLRFTQLPGWDPGQTGPLAREYFSMWLDPTDADRLWVYGGFHYVPRQFTTGHDAWSLDLRTSAWTPHSDGPALGLPGAGLATLADGRAYRYGGLSFNAQSGSAATPFVLHEIRTGTAGLSFTELHPGGASRTGDYQASFFHHPRTNQIYSVCGMNTDVGAHCNVSAFDPESGSWSRVVVDGTAPTGRNGHFWAYDPATDRLIIFSGEGYPGTNDCANCLDDTWALELSSTPPRWVELMNTAPPVGRRNGAYVLDPVGHRLFIWGGTPNGRTSAPGLWALDLRPGSEAWHEVPTVGGAPVRTSGAAVFDASRRRILFAFGNNPAPLTDLWALELSEQ